MEKRGLGKLGEKIMPLGFGCAAIGGHYTRGGKAVSYGPVDERDASRAIESALANGIRLFDVANIYGVGQAERLLGQVLLGRHHDVVLQVKFGASFDEVTRQQIDYSDTFTPEMIENSLHGSLRRLRRDFVDIFQFQIADYPVEQLPELLEALENLVSRGKIRAYSFGTPNVEAAELFAAAPHCATIITGHNLFMDIPAMLTMLERHDVALLAGLPLFMGILSGKYDQASTFASTDRRQSLPLDNPFFAQRFEQLEKLRPILCDKGRTMAQGALLWLLSRHHLTIPLPGFKTAAQVEEMVHGLAFGRFLADEMAQIDEIMTG